MGPHVISIFIFLTSALAENAYVQSVEDFLIHTMAHKERVIELSAAYFKLLIAKDPKRWGYLTENRVREFASYHDNPKLEEENARRLFKYYGINKENLAPASTELEALQFLIAKIEKEEKAALSIVFGNLQEYRDLEFITFVADEVDRGKDPVAREEMGRLTRLASARLKMNQIKFDILVLEENYSKIIHGHRYGDLRMRSNPEEIWKDAARLRDATRQVTSCVLRKVQSLAH